MDSNVCRVDARNERRPVGRERRRLERRRYDLNPEAYIVRPSWSEPHGAGGQVAPQRTLSSVVGPAALGK